MPATLSLQRSGLRYWFWLLLLLNIVFIIGFKLYLHPLTSGEIVQFEIAKTTTKAAAIIDNWNAEGKIEKAKVSILVDYFFIFLYMTGLIVSVMFLSEETHHPLLKRSGRFFRWLIPVAGICDVLENVFMWQSLNGHFTAMNVMFAYDMAVTKFSILIVTFLFIVVCLLFWLMRKLFPAG